MASSIAGVNLRKSRLKMFKLTPVKLVATTAIICFGYLSLVVTVITSHSNKTSFTSNSTSFSAGAMPESEVSFASVAAPGSFSNETYCYIHVGKTAGSKLSCELGFRYAPTCPANTTLHAESAFATKTDGYIHMFANSCKPNAEVFLISVRNPIDRIISWYNYENAKQKWVHQPGQLGQPRYQCLKRLQKWQDWDGCFETLDELATNCTPPSRLHVEDTTDQGSIQDSPSDSAHRRRRKACQKLAWNVVRGNIGCAVHNEFNYANYRNAIEKLQSSSPANATTATRILVIRSEHMAEDWNGLEVFFGGTNTTAGNAIFKSILNKSNGKSPISSRALQNLCRALCDEIQIYKSFILSAENLSREQRSESIGEIRSMCPQETTDIRMCPSFERGDG